MSRPEVAPEYAVVVRFPREVAPDDALAMAVCERVAKAAAAALKDELREFHWQPPVRYIDGTVRSRYEMLLLLEAPLREPALAHLTAVLRAVADGVEVGYGPIARADPPTPTPGGATAPWPRGDKGKP